MKGRDRSQSMASMASLGPEASGSTPRNKKLTLHIPNAWPRSPRTSPLPSPLARSIAEEEEAGTSNSAVPHAQTSESRTGVFETFFRHGQTILTSRKCASNMTRDFCARERTFLSWVKLAAVLTSLSGLLFLQINFESIVNPDTDRQLAYETAVLLQALGQNSSLPSKQYTNGFKEDGTIMKTGPFDTDAGAFSGGSIYGVLALLALAIGTTDYLTRERALERIDALTQAEADANGEHHNPTKARLADEDIEHARSGKVVNVMTGLLALAVAATAVMLLIVDKVRG